jgi:hypothetical protein
MIDTCRRLGAIIGDSQLRGQWAQGHIDDREDMQFSFGAELVPLWEKACQGGVEIYASLVEDGRGPCGSRALASS